MPRFHLLLLLLGAASTSLARADEREAAIAPKTEKIDLFDGKSLDGFYTWLSDTKYEDPKKVFRVTDGMLHITGDGLGALVTKKEYRDYHLVLEFKFGERVWQNRQDKTKDSGLLVHSRGAEGGYGGIWMPSIEVQIIEGGMGDFILVSGPDENGDPVPLSIKCESARDRDGEVIWQKGGKVEVFDNDNRQRVNWYGRDPDWEDKLGFRGKDDVDTQDGWTRFDVYCDGGAIRTYVNGVLVNESLESTPTFGKIQLQTELAELFVRRFELWPIGKGPEPANAEQ